MSSDNLQTNCPPDEIEYIGQMLTLSREILVALENVNLQNSNVYFTFQFLANNWQQMFDISRMEHSEEGVGMIAELKEFNEMLHISLTFD